MAIPDDYQNALERLAQATAARVQNEASPVVIVALLNRARARAVALADLYAARQFEDLTGSVTTTSGVLPADDSDRLAKAVETIASGEPGDSVVRLERLARSEVFTAAQDATLQALSGREVDGRHVGWVRQLEQGHCQLCEWWARDGRVFPKDHRMPTHPNCNCVQRIVISETKPLPVKRRNRGRRS